MSERMTAVIRTTYNDGSGATQTFVGTKAELAEKVGHACIPASPDYAGTAPFATVNIFPAPNETS